MAGDDPDSQGKDDALKNTFKNLLSIHTGFEARQVALHGDCGAFLL